MVKKHRNQPSERAKDNKHYEPEEIQEDRKTSLFQGMQWAMARTIKATTYRIKTWSTPETTQEKLNHTHPEVATSTHVGKDDTAVTQRLSLIHI